MPYPQFTKVIINHFISKDRTISMRNMINLHTIHDDLLLGTLKFVSKIHDYQQYGALIPDNMINQDIKDSKAYKTYYDLATRKDTPNKARKYKKVASPSRKLSPVLEEEPAEKPKRAKKPAKKSTIVPTAGVVIIYTPCESLSKKKTPTKVDKGKGMDLLSNAALLEVAQVPDESEDKTTRTNKGTGTKPGVPDVPKYLSKSENLSGGDSGDNDDNDDDSDEVTNDDDEDDVESDANEDKEVSDSEKTDTDEDENLKVKQNDGEEEEHEEAYVRTPDSFDINDDDEDYNELYKDVNVKSKVIEHEEVGKGDAEMLILLMKVLLKKKFARKFINLDNVPPVIDEVASMMNVKTPHEESNTQAPPNPPVPVTAILETSTVHVTTVTLIIQPFSSIP
ncbi:hypothetical protein Tco_0327022 [Tanacetum coccineum]